MSGLKIEKNDLAELLEMSKNIMKLLTMKRYKDSLEAVRKIDEANNAAWIQANNQSLKEWDVINNSVPTKKGRSSYRDINANAASETLATDERSSYQDYMTFYFKLMSLYSKMVDDLHYNLWEAMFTLVGILHIVLPKVLLDARNEKVVSDFWTGLTLQAANYLQKVRDQIFNPEKLELFRSDVTHKDIAALVTCPVGQLKIELPIADKDSGIEISDEERNEFVNAFKVVVNGWLNEHGYFLNNQNNRYEKDVVQQDGTTRMVAITPTQFTELKMDKDKGLAKHLSSTLVRGLDDMQNQINEVRNPGAEPEEAPAPNPLRAF